MFSLTKKLNFYSVIAFAILLLSIYSVIIAKDKESAFGFALFIGGFLFIGFAAAGNRRSKGESPGVVAKSDIFALLGILGVLGLIIWFWLTFSLT
jgi:hypothetical protein